MTNTLITFLGRSPKEQGAYRTTRYQFRGEIGEPTAFFGYFLQQKFQPQRLVVLGTTGSMWDHLFEGDLALGDDLQELRLQLIDDVAAHSVAQHTLDELSPALSRALECDVTLRIIPAAASEPQQLELLGAIADCIEDGESVSLDITHSFRHLPMIGFLSLLYLQSARPGVTIEHIWYGEFDQDTRQGEVRDLAGLMTVHRWIEALQSSETQGDLTPVSRLLGDHPAAESLRQASFLENIHRGSDARKPLREVRKSLDLQPLDGPAQLFEPLLRSRISWIDEDRLHQRQAAQAWQALAREDYLRATLYGFEAYLTRKAQESGEVPPGRESHYEDRKSIQEGLDKDRTFGKSAEGKAYKTLRNLRNALAHGDKQKKGDIQRLMNSPADLHSALQELFATLLDGSGQGGK